MEGIGDDAEGFLEGLQEFIRIRGDGIFFLDASFRSLERDDAERGAHFFPYFFHLLPGKPGKLVDAARLLVVRERGQNYLTADEIPELLDEDTPQQLLVSAFRRYRR